MTDWYVAFTTPSGERLAKSDLEDLGFEVFLPVRRVKHRPARHRRDRRARIVEKPLFPRYLFVGTQPGYPDFAGMRRSKRVLELLSDARDRPLKLPPRTIDGLQRSLERQDPATARAHCQALAAGLQAMVGTSFAMPSGPFKGLIATIQVVARKEVLLDVKGEGGATCTLTVPILFLEQAGVYTAQDDQHKRSPASGGVG